MLMHFLIIIYKTRAKSPLYSSPSPIIFYKLLFITLPLLLTFYLHINLSSQNKNCNMFFTTESILKQYTLFISFNVTNITSHHFIRHMEQLSYISKTQSKIALICAVFTKQILASCTSIFLPMQIFLL